MAYPIHDTLRINDIDGCYLLVSRVQLISISDSAQGSLCPYTVYGREILQLSSQSRSLASSRALLSDGWQV